MSENTPTAACLNCGQPETAVALIAVRHDGRQHWICAGCLPVLIHKTDQIMPAFRGEGSSTA